MIGYRGKEVQEFINSLPPPLPTKDEITTTEPEYIEEQPDQSEMVTATQAIEDAIENNFNFQIGVDYKKAVESLINLKTDYEFLSGQIADLDAAKKNSLAKAKFPINGLSFSDEGVEYNGVHFDQASSAEKLRVSLAIAIAANPKLRVIRISDGSLLDSKNRKIIEEMATANDFQIWLESVDETGKVGIYIEDGAVKANNYCKE